MQIKIASFRTLIARESSLSSVLIDIAQEPRTARAAPAHLNSALEA
jgi:hypothetical protein